MICTSLKKEKNTTLLVLVFVPYLVELGCKDETEVLAYSVKMACREALAGKGSRRWEPAVPGTVLLIPVQQCEAAALQQPPWAQPSGSR